MIVEMNDIPDQLVTEIEKEIGRKFEYWNTVNPKKIIAAVMNISPKYVGLLGIIRKE